MEHFLGKLMTFAITANHKLVGLPEPNPLFNIFSVFAFETFGSFFILFTAISLWDPTIKTKYGQEWIALVIGFLISILNMGDVFISGASFNIFRHLVPAIISVNWQHDCWIYYVGPIFGLFMAYFVFYVLFYKIHDKKN